jgi:HK97 family phage prohead protease
MIEERSLPLVRSLPDASLKIEGEKLKGYAVVFGATSAGPVGVNGVNMLERIDAGAFTDSLSSNVTFTFSHKDFAEYGDTKSGTLRLKEDAVGISFELDLPAYANTLRSQIESGAIKGMSFGFAVRAMEVRNQIRHIVKGDLLHISPVYNPAYPQTSIELCRAEVTHNSKKKLLDLKAKM